MNKVVFITGTTSGIGKTIALYLHQCGFKVIGTYRSKPVEHCPFQQIQLDVTDNASIKKGIEHILKTEKRIDILINNAGVGIFGTTEEISIEEVKQVFDTNVFGTWTLIQSVLPIMRRQNSGKIINVSSIAGLIGMPFQSNYSASKHALEGLTASLRLELLSSNIEVTNICPGDFKTNFTINRPFVKSNIENYQTNLSEAKTKVETDERNGSDPEMIAKLVETLINQKKKLKARYLVGKPMEKFLIQLSRFLPATLIEKMTADHFNIK